jgi:GMP synthase (glutamine-hydrolysing)
LTFLNIFNDFSSNSRGLQPAQTVLLTHGDSVERVCDKFKICATSSSDIVAGIFNEQSRIYGVQFHPEVDLTLQGKKILSNFLFEISRLTPTFTMNSRRDECVRYIQEKVGSNKVLVSFLILNNFKLD